MWEFRFYAFVENSKQFLKICELARTHKYLLFVIIKWYGKSLTITGKFSEE